MLLYWICQSGAAIWPSLLIRTTFHGNGNSKGSWTYTGRGCREIGFRATIKNKANSSHNVLLPQKAKKRGLYVAPPFWWHTGPAFALGFINSSQDHRLCRRFKVALPGHLVIPPIGGG